MRLLRRPLGLPGYQSEMDVSYQMSGCLKVLPRGFVIFLNSLDISFILQISNPSVSKAVA
jgi:hypothetical protein